MSAATLRKAAAVVRERGLAKGTLEDSDGRVCGFGAVHVALTGAAGLCTTFRECGKADAAFRGVTGRGLNFFSDDPSVTAEDVARALEAAAARMEAGAWPS